MDPKVWGGPLWTSLIYIAKGYPVDPSPSHQAQYTLFFHSLGNTLPCFSCKKNYLSHLKAEPIKLGSRSELLNWLHRIHNRTLTQMGKGKLTYQEFIDKYINPQRSFWSRKSFILLILVAIVVGWYYFFYKKYSRPFFLVK